VFKVFLRGRIRAERAGARTPCRVPERYSGGVFRKELVELLRGRMLPLSEIARLERVRVQDLADDLEHLRKSLRQAGMKLVVEPATCQKCEFVFTKGRLVKPGRCPKCRSTWIDEPRVGVEGRGGGNPGDG
jgi:hypothetical protein